MKTEVQKNIIETFKKLNDILFSFSQEELNMVPYQGSWTAGQTTQHIILVCSGYPELFAGNTEKTTRKPDEKIKEIEAIFLDFNTKMDAPDFVKPEIKDYNKNSLTLSLLNLESELLTASETFDLTLTCLDFEVPGFGKFTILEWISFGLIHAQRHTKQLHDIFKYVTKL
jgi:DinB family protein